MNLTSTWRIHMGYPKMFRYSSSPLLLHTMSPTREYLGRKKREMKKQKKGEIRRNHEHFVHFSSTDSVSTNFLSVVSWHISADRGLELNSASWQRLKKLRVVFKILHLDDYNSFISGGNILILLIKYVNCAFSSICSIYSDNCGHLYAVNIASFLSVSLRTDK